MTTEPTAEAPTPAPAKLSLASIAATVANTEAVPFVPLLADFTPSTVTLFVYSDQHPKVQARVNELEDGRRRAEQLLAAQAMKARPGQIISKTEDEQEHYSRMVAARIAGWEGIEDPFSDANAIRLFQLIPDWSSQVLNKAKELGRFTKASPTP
jgi:hypothetical protein